MGRSRPTVDHIGHRRVDRVMFERGIVDGELKIWPKKLHPAGSARSALAGQKRGISSPIELIPLVLANAIASLRLTAAMYNVRVLTDERR
jgi:hypothetical protein